MPTVREILQDLISGKIDVDMAMKKLQGLTSIEDLAVIDLNRESRSGVPEVIFAESKHPETLIHIIKEMVDKNGYALLTRMNSEKVKFIETSIKNYVVEVSGQGDHLTVLVKAEQWTPPEAGGKVAVITAGTSDIPYAREAEAICHVMGIEVISFYDVGVAGIHRLVEPMKKIREKNIDAVIVFAGMEGALPTVVASLVDIPVIGVPIPTGYGFGGKGETALKSMLQSCAPGLAVVNIGNGLGAGAFAALIARRCHIRE